MGTRSRRTALIALTSLTLALTAVPAAHAASASCREVDLPVSLTRGQAAGEHVHGRLCQPAGSHPRTVQLLLPGLTYDHTYWDLPDREDTGRYSYTRAATAAGAATFALDRIGTGASSHPTGLAVTVDSNAFVVHQVVAALRSGAVDPAGFGSVVLVGHSYGSWVSWYEASDYQDVDAVVLSGISHQINLTAPVRLLPNFYPAALDHAFTGRGLDPTYLTSQPGQRYMMFADPAPVDPALRAYDEAHKQTVTAGEIANFPLILVRPLDIRVPVLLVNGTEDRLFCGVPGGADCSSAQALTAAERPRLGGRVPSVDAFVLPGSGHDLNEAPNARDWFAVAQRWIARTAP
ncbi:alpha/beta hydrolase [Kutzneria viridogrisea]|uniref:AB hydrolase-1 domain-containing protein n=2 Tax=Kutzneria TaxID=43356 RepID=W5WJ18_9PSEU|nr:alpha/beta hydrolase [Kutzneria albida]AHH98139.1 hypothetical protein KALB_4777 [Kutzneria albida DSM 43870]MBA8924178.1 pimeloyl-ACP methyl ester carboxylesterase [Kutzneria viridogrisea]